MKNIKLLLSFLLCLGLLCSCSPNKPKNIALREAICADDLRRVELLISKGASFSINVRDSDGVTVLMLAAEAGNVDIVKMLLAAGANVNAKDFDGDAVLVWAMGEGHVDVVEVLLAAGADVNAKNNDGDTVLMQAVGAGHIDVIKLLLAAGADINAKDEDGDTARDMAMMWQEEYAEIVKLLDGHRQEK